jgi:hypothetical protein
MLVLFYLITVKLLNVSEKYMTNNYSLDTGRQVWLAITIPAKEKSLLKIYGGERYAGATW